MAVKILKGDCLELLPSLEAESIDACVTDPPYHLTANKKGGSGTASVDLGTPYGRTRITVGNGAGGFMGQAWDGGDVAFQVETWKKVLRVLKPGGHLLAFGGTRTYHRLACAIEDAGFEIRDQIQWLYGQGFPKSHDVSKGIDRKAGANRDIVGHRKHPTLTDPSKIDRQGKQQFHAENPIKDEWELTAPATNEAREWDGWGTALKPACEPIVLARKPLSETTVAANVLKWGTGAININGCRVGTERREYSGGMGRFNDKAQAHGYRPFINGVPSHTDETFVAEGRWPANVIHDGSEEVVVAFPESGPGPGNVHSAKENGGGVFGGGRMGVENIFKDSGNTSRFFYTAKADKGDRLSSKHPTVKPVDLMAYLCRLVTPPKGLVLDPFAGSGTTGMACLREGFDCTLIEREPSYVLDIERRVAHVSGADAPLFANPHEN